MHVVRFTLLSIKLGCGTLDLDKLLFLMQQLECKTPLDKALVKIITILVTNPIQRQLLHTNRHALL